MKILAIDLGQRRIGLAVADKKTISGLDTIVYDNLKDALTKLTEIIRREDARKIIIGLPCGNEKSEDQIHSFALELAKLVEIPINFVDETLTSKEAERILAKSKLNPRQEKYKREVDKISAKLIAEQYLNIKK
jgi:putative holliday junction resolvase